MTTLLCWNCATRTEVAHGERLIKDTMWYVRCPACRAMCVVEFPTDTPPNGEAFTGALEAAGDTSAPVAAPVAEYVWGSSGNTTGVPPGLTVPDAPVVNDCRDCRHWEPDVMDDYSDGARGVCRSLRMVTLAKAGGCSYSFVRDRRVRGRR